ncbi:Protein kinase domain-containing protein ppk32 [Coemansia sp. Benny D115]|nr:Protein kinase domain-containing protein ppk32 [Coemansia sp. Benny D115]
MFVFISEPVVGTLGGHIGDKEALDEMAVQHGLLQLSEALVFLHRDARLVHGNLVPGSVLIDARGDWKLAGFGFSHAIDDSTENGRGSYEDPYCEDYGFPMGASANKGFMAPEARDRGLWTPAADAYSLGCLGYSLYNDGQPPSTTQLSSSDTVNRVPAVQLNGVPEGLQPVLRRLWNPQWQDRLTMEELASTEYFSNTLVAALRFLEQLAAQPVSEQASFLRALPRALPGFSKRVQQRTILPLLLAPGPALSDPSLLPDVLTCALAIACSLEKSEFIKTAWPTLKSLSTQITESPAALSVVIEHMSTLQKLVGNSDQFRQTLLPMLITALTPGAPSMERALQCTPDICVQLNSSDTSSLILPRVQMLYTRASVLPQKLQALECLRHMLPYLDRPTILEKLLPMLRRTKSREPAVILGMLPLYEYCGTRVLDTAGAAKEVVGELWTHVAETRLSPGDLDRVLGVVKSIETKIEQEAKKRAASVAGSGAAVLAAAATAGNSGIGGSELIDDDDSESAWGWPDDPPATSASKTAAATNTSNALKTNLLRTNPLVGNPLAAIPRNDNNNSNSKSALVDISVADSQPPLQPLVPQKTSRIAGNKSVPVAAASGRLGAVKLGSGNTSNGRSTTNANPAFGFTLPPPPTSSATSSKSPAPLSSMTSPDSLKQTRLPPASSPNWSTQPPVSSPTWSAQPLRAQPLAQAPQLSFGQNGPPPRNVSSQKPHIGGKTKDLSDFDPFA